MTTPVTIRSRPFLHGNIILPPEVTDIIIDHLRGHSDALRQCALTCRAWRPRSQLNLIHTVTIRSRAALKAFSALSRDTRWPPLLNSLYSLHLLEARRFSRGFHWPTERFVHLVPLMPPQVLRGVKVLDIHGINWHECPPHPTFRFHAALFPGVVSLTLRLCTFQSLTELFLVLSAFPLLSDLHLKRVSCASIRTPSILSTFQMMRSRLRMLDLYGLADELNSAVLEFLLRTPCLETLSQLELLEPSTIDATTMRKLGELVRSSLEVLTYDMTIGVNVLLTPWPRLRSLSLKSYDMALTANTLAGLLSRMACYSLRELEITVQPPRAEAIEQTLLMWYQLDDVLADERFASLTAVELMWWRDISVWNGEETTRAAFLEQLPRLRARGILEVSVEPSLSR